MLFGNKVHVSITPRGLDHPARSGLGPKAARSDLSKSFGERRLGILETLAVLGEARTMEITAALAGMDRPANGLMSGQLIARLVARGFVEACPGDPRVRLSYRLTEAGRSATALIARFRTSPGRARVDERIAAYWAQRTIRREIGLRLRSRSKDLVASPCQQAVLDALADGPRSTRALQDAMGDRIRNKRSVHLMLRTLEKRGAVKQKGKEGMMKVWCLRSANDDASRDLRCRMSRRLRNGRRLSEEPRGSEGISCMAGPTARSAGSTEGEGGSRVNEARPGALPLDAAKGLCPLDPRQGRSPWNPLLERLDGRGTGRRDGCSPTDDRRSGCTHRGDRPPSRPTSPTNGLLRLRLSWGFRGQSPLTGSRGRAPGLASFTRLPPSPSAI